MFVYNPYYEKTVHDFNIFVQKISLPFDSISMNVLKLPLYLAVSDYILKCPRVMYQETEVYVLNFLFVFVLSQRCVLICLTFGPLKYFKCNQGL